MFTHLQNISYVAYTFCQKLWKVFVLKPLTEKYHLNNGAYARYGPNKSITRFRRQHSNDRRHIPAIFLRVVSIVCCHIECGIWRVYAAAGDNYAVPGAH